MNNSEQNKTYRLKDIEIKKHSKIIINGERGNLESLYNQTGAKNISSPVLLFLHPQPNSNGTMYNKIIQETMNLAAKMGFVVLAINFGGVGNSAGRIENGFGEFLDAASAFKWLSDNHSYSRQRWVFGFSFGSYIGAQLTMRRPEIDGFIFLSTPIDIYDFSFFSPFPVNGLVIHSSHDQIVKENKILNFFGKNDRCGNISYTRIEEKISHFFTNINFEQNLGYSIYHYLKKHIDQDLIRKIEEFECDFSNKKPFITFNEYAELANYQDDSNQEQDIKELGESEIYQGDEILNN